MDLQSPKGCPSTAQEAVVGNPTCTYKTQRDVPPQLERLWWAIPHAPPRPKGMSLHSPGGYSGQSHMHLQSTKGCPSTAQEAVGCPSTAQEAMMGNPICTSDGQRDVPPQLERLWWAIPHAPPKHKGMSLHSPGGCGGQSHLHLQDPKGCPSTAQEAMMGNPICTSDGQRDVPPQLERLWDDPPQLERLWWAIPHAPPRPKGMSLHSPGGYSGQSHMHLQSTKGCPSTAQEAMMGNPICTSKTQRDVPPQLERLWWAIPHAPTRPKGMSHDSPTCKGVTLLC
ncbi:hypothetical protein BKA83DRAFT_4128564 [Pisolithus microcarpus]|nr:hypothetical protein BKA83DRAFT_4128564 [Pisolithus microcarpus]